MRDRDADIAAEFHRLSPLPSEMTVDDLIDDNTWRDLGIESLLDLIDQTVTTAGECILYRALRRPLESEATLTQRRVLLRHLHHDLESRSAVYMALQGARRHFRDGADLVRLLWGEAIIPRPDRWKFNALALAAIAALAGFIESIALGSPNLWCFIAVLVMFFVNGVAHVRETRRFEGRIGGLRQLRALLNGAHALPQLAAPELTPQIMAIRALLPALQPIRQHLRWMLHLSALGRNMITEMILEYFNIFLLEEVRSFHAVLPILRRHREDLQRLFTLIGELDAWQSVANYRGNRRDTVEPDLDPAGPFLSVTAARHPLVEDCVPNSFEFTTTGAVITGSNMSGKTTLMRTVAVNALLAQTLLYCHAGEYRSRRLRIHSVLDEGDDLAAGKSYFLAEAERLLTLVRLAQQPALVLALVDEPLAGTSSPQRFAASQAILSYVAQRSARVMLTTHDVDLAQLLQRESRFAGFHFSDYASSEGMRFDYAMQPGLAYHANAIEVLEMLHYPAAITASARAANARLAAASAAGPAT